MAPKEKLLFCGLCNLQYDSFTQFEEHQWSMLHHRHMENKRNEKTHFCALCKQSWTSLPDYGVHLISRYHKNAALKRLQILKNANLEPKIPNRQSDSFQFREPIERISSKNDERKSPVKDSAISMSERTPLRSSSASRISPETHLSKTFREIRVRSSYRLTHVKDVSYTRSPRERRSAPYHRPTQTNRYSQELGMELPPSIRACRWEGSNDVFRQRFPEDKFQSWREERRAAHLSRPIPREKNFGSSSTLRKPERFNDNDFAMEGMTLFENRSSFDSDRFSGRGFSNDGPSPFALEGREHELRRNYEDSVNPEIDRLPQRTKISNSTCHTDLPNVETEYSDRQKWPSTIQSWPSTRQNAISNRERETPNRQKVITTTRRNEPTRKQKEPPTRNIEHSTRQSKPSTQQSGSSTVQNVSSTRQCGSSTVQSVSSVRQHEPSTRKTGPSIRKTGPSIREVSSNKQNEPTTKQNGPSTTPSVPSTRKNGPSIRKTGTSIREVSSNKQNEPTTKQNGPSSAQCEPSTEKIGPPVRPVSSVKQNGPSTTPRRSCTRPNGPSTRQDGPSTRRDGPPIIRDGPPIIRDGPSLIRDGPSLRQVNSTKSNEPSTRQSEPSAMPNVPPTGRDKVGSTSQTSVELQMAVSSEETYQSQVKMKDIASVAVTENSSVRFGKSVDSEKTLTGHKSDGSSALVPETPRERTGVIGTGITGSDGSNSNMSAIAKTPCVESVSREVGREKVICRKETLGDSRESTAATVPQVSMRHVINTPKEAGISSKKDKNYGGSENKQPTITDGLSASARARVDLSANRKDLQGSGVRTATSRNSSAANNAGLIENNLSTIQSLSVSADKSSYTVSGSSQAPSHEVPTHCSPDLGKDKEPSATEGSSLRMSDVSQQKPQSGINSANSSRQGNVPKHSSRGDADSVSSDKPSSSNAPLCGKTTNVPSATCKLITAYIRDKSLGNKSSDNNILIPDLIQKHVEKLQRYRSAQPNLTSSRVQHHPSQHLDLALSDLKHVLLHLFEQPVSNHRKKLQEAQLKKLFANASKTSERFKRFGVHLESLDPDDSEMIKMLERLTEEDLELLSKEDSKEDLQELLSLFELAEEPPPSSGNSQATNEGTDGGQMRHRVIGNGSSTDAERRKDPETTSPARGGSTSDDSSSDVELIQSVQMEIVVSSESEEEEDEVTKLPTLPTLPTSQNVPSEEADNSLHGQVFQLSLKETEFQQQLKAIRKEQKVLEERIKCDTAKVVSLKKTKVEMKKKMKLLRKNRLKLTKGHTTLPQPAINTVVEGGSFLASSRNSLIDMAVAGAQQQNESSIRSMPLTSQEVLLPHSGSGSVLTPTQIMTAGNVHMIHQASPSSHDPTVPRDLDASNTSVSQAPNQMFKQFTIPPSAMGISIQRLSNEDLLMLARQDLLNNAQTSQVPSSFMFGVAPSAQITSNAMAASSDQSGLETPQLIEGLRPQGVGTGPVGSLGVEKVNKLGLGNAQQPSLGVTNLSQTPKAIGRGNAQQPSQKVGTMSQTPNAVGPGNALQRSQKVGTMSQTPNAVGPGNALQPSQREGTMSQTPNSVGPGNALQRSQKVGTMSQTPNVVGPGNALQPSQRVGTMSQTPNAVGPVNALQPSQREGTMSQTPNVGGPANVLQPSQKVGTMSQTPNVVGPGNALQPSQRVGTMSQTPNAVGPGNALQPSQRVGTMSQTPNVVGPGNALQSSKGVGTMSQTLNAVGPVNVLQPSKEVDTLSQTPNVVGPGNALQPSQREGTMSQTPNVVGPVNALQPSQKVGTVSQTPNAVRLRNAQQPSQVVATHSQAHKAEGPGNAQQPSQGIGSLIPLTLTPQVTSSSSYGGQLPVTSSRENALAQSVPGSLAVDIPYPVSISKVMPTATSLEANPPQMLQEEGHQGVIIKTEPEADHLVETERSEERPQPSSEHGMTASTRSPSDQIPTRSSSNQPTPVEYGTSSSVRSPKPTQVKSRKTFVKQYTSKRKCRLAESQLPASKRLNKGSKERKGDENDANRSEMQLKVLLKSCLPKGQRLPTGSGVVDPSSVANSSDSNSRSQGMEDEIPVTSEYSLRSVGSRRNADVLYHMRRPQSGKARTTPRRTAPAPNLKKSQIRPKKVVNNSSGVENSNKQSGESQEGAGSPFSFDNLQKQIQEQGERERQLEVYRSRLVKKHMKTIQSLQRLGLSEFYIQIARKGTLASRAETVMLRNETKRMRQLKKGSGQIIDQPIVKPIQQPAKDKSLLQEARRLKRQAKAQRKKAEKLEVYKSIGMPAEFVAIMAKGPEASKEEQNALRKESKNYKKEYFAGRRALRKEKKLHRREENQARLRLRSTARKQFKDLILPSLSSDRTIKTEGAGHRSQLIENVWSSQKMTDNLAHLPTNEKTANAVIGLSVTDDKIYTYTVDGTIRFYRLQNLSCEGSYSGHEKRITGLHLCEDPKDKRSRLLFTSSRDQQLQCRVLRDGEPTMLSLDLRHPITCMAATSGSLYLGLANGHVDVLSIQSFKRYESFVCHNKEIGCVTIAEINYEKYLVTGAYDAKLAIHSIASGSLHGTLEGHASSVLCVKAAGKFIISGSVDSVLLQHDFLTRRLMKRYNHHTKAITDISVHRSKIYTACLDDKVRIFDFHKMELVTTIDVENVLSLCNNKQTVYVGTTDGKVKKLSSLNVNDEKNQEDQ